MASLYVFPTSDIAMGAWTGAYSSIDDWYDTGDYIGCSSVNETCKFHVADPLPLAVYSQVRVEVYHLKSAGDGNIRCYIYHGGSLIGSDPMYTTTSWTYDYTPTWSLSSLSKAEVADIRVWFSTEGVPFTATQYVASCRLRFTYTPTIQINIGDSWKEVESVQINIGDVWKDVDTTQINIGDVWKDTD